MRLMFAGILAVVFLPALATAAPVVDVSDKWTLNTWPAPTACNTIAGVSISPPAACTGIIVAANSPAPSAGPGWKLVRNNNIVVPTVDFGDSFAVSYDDGIIGDYVKLTGSGKIRADSNYFDKRIYTGAPTSSYIVGFHVDQLALDATALLGTVDQRTSTAGFNIKRGGTTYMSLQWTATVDTIAPLNNFITTPAPFVLTSVVPGTLPIGTSSAVFGQAAVTSPGATFLLDLGPFITGQKFTVSYDMFAEVTGAGLGSGFASIGDPFGFGTGPGIDWGGLSVSDVPAPAGLALFGLGALALAGRLAARRS